MLNINKEGIESRVQPPLGRCYNNLRNAYDKMTLIKKAMPNDFKNSSEVIKIENEINEIRGEVNNIKKWLTGVVEKFNNVERKNEQLFANLLYEGGSYTKTQTSKKASRISYDHDWGTFEVSNNEYISGYYTSTTGRVYAICYQHYVTKQGKGNFFGVNWNGTCNRAAEAAILSAYTEVGIDEIIQSLNNEHRDGRVIASNEYWNEYGLQRSEDYFWCYGQADRVKKGNTEVEGTYEEILGNHLKTTDGYALVWVTTSGVYEGESGKIWVRNFDSESEVSGVHWVSVLDYRVVDGQEQIAVADPGANLDENGNTPVQWYNIGEFQYGISRMVLISEQ